MRRTEAREILEGLEYRRSREQLVEIYEQLKRRFSSEVDFPTIEELKRSEAVMADLRRSQRKFEQSVSVVTPDADTLEYVIREAELRRLAIALTRPPVPYSGSISPDPYTEDQWRQMRAQTKAKFVSQNAVIIWWGCGTIYDPYGDPVDCGAGLAILPNRAGGVQARKSKAPKANTRRALGVPASGKVNAPNATDPRLQEAYSNLWRLKDKRPGGTIGELLREIEAGGTPKHLIKAKTPSQQSNQTCE